MCFDNLRKKHSKTYIRKNKGGLFNIFFLINFRNDIKKDLYIYNIVVGFLLIFSMIGSIVYLILWISGYELKLHIMPDLTVRIIILFTYLRLLRLILDKIR